MTDNTTESTDGVPLADLPLENTRRTLLRVLGGAAAVGGASGLAVGGGEEEDEEDEGATNTGTSDQADAETDPEDDEEHDGDSTVTSGDVFDLSGFALKKDELHLDLLRITPTVDGKRTELFTLRGFEATVEDDVVSETEVDDVEIAAALENEVVSMLDTLANGETPGDLENAPAPISEHLEQIDTKHFERLRSAIDGKGADDALEHRLQNGGLMGGLLILEALLLLIVIVIVIIALSFNNVEA